MEKIYLPSEFSCTDNINIAEHFKTFSDIILGFETNSTEDTKEDVIASITGFSKTDILALEEATSIEKLDCPDETPILPPPDSILSLFKLKDPWPITESAVCKLETAKFREHFLKTRSKEHFEYREKVRLNFETIIAKKDFDNSNNLDMFRETVVNVRIYQPFFHKYATKNSRVHCKYGHEIVALGSNTLAELRDKILCNNDIGLNQQCDDPNVDMETLFGKAKEEYPSGFFFIDNVFYNDFRHQNAIDYSMVIRNWAESKKIGKLETAEMDKVRLESLSPRIGYPYVYQHQGNCEHIMVFSDIRLLQRNDPMSFRDYPWYKSISRYNCQVCRICGLSPSRWVLQNADRLPNNNTYLCHECFVSYNYVDNVKVGNFTSYLYFDKSMIL